ncbi:MAG: hypothetical protein ABIR56_05780 [Polaromonas sp.]
MTAKDENMPLDSSGDHEAQKRIIDNLTSTVITVPLLRMMEEETQEKTATPKGYDLIIDLRASLSKGVNRHANGSSAPSMRCLQKSRNARSVRSWRLASGTCASSTVRSTCLRDLMR